MDVEYVNPLRFNAFQFQRFLVENELATEARKGAMLAVKRCRCDCTDGCISNDCNCKLETLKLFCKTHNVSVAQAKEMGYPESGWYKDDLLQGLQVPEPLTFKHQLQIFECCQDCACMQGMTHTVFLLFETFQKMTLESVL